MSDSKSRTSKPSFAQSAPVARLDSGAPQTALQALFAGKNDPLRRALWLDALERQLRPSLPPALAAHARFANVDGSKLVFLVDSPVWQARLRLASTELIEAARSVGLECDQVVVKTTSQSLWPAPPSPRAAFPLSPAAHKALQAVVASLDIPTPDPGKKAPSGTRKGAP